jgi:hypothetical protein
MTLNLQTRPFASAVNEDSNPVDAQNEIKSYKYDPDKDILLKLIDSPIAERSPTDSDVVQRYTRGHFAKTRSKNALASMPIQAKLNIGEPNDRYEKEADATAAKVVQQINSAPQGGSVQKQESMESEDKELQMKPAISKIQKQELMEDEDEKLQAKSLVQSRENLNGGEASTDLESSIQSARGGGQSLDPNLQEKMGQAMGADFSGVKIHTDSQSDHLNKSIQAKAFTTGQDVFFRQGEYEPSSRGGQELIAHELTHVVQQNGGMVQRSPLQNVLQRDDDGSIVGGYGGDSIEGGGNFLEFLDDAYSVLKTVNDPKSGKVQKGIAGSKALGSLTGTVLAGLKANQIEKMTSCLGAMSEGLKIFDAGKEIWEAVRKVDFWNDTTMQTFENVAVVVGKLGDFIIGSAKIAEGFVKAMEWTTGKLSAFANWLPISELIMKGVKFMTSVKKWIFAFTSYKKLKVLQGTIDLSKQQQVGYLVDEQWSRLKNGAVPFASTGVDFASETGKYFPSLGINTAIVASLGTASKAVPLGHKILTTGYDFMRQGWRKMVKNYASTNVAGYLAAIDKADLDSFRDGLATFVFNERNQPHGMLILESLGLGASVQTMGDPEAKDAIDEAVQDIK